METARDETWIGAQLASNQPIPSAAAARKPVLIICPIAASQVRKACNSQNAVASGSLRKHNSMVRRKRGKRAKTRGQSRFSELSLSMSALGRSRRVVGSPGQENARRSGPLQNGYLSGRL